MKNIHLQILRDHPELLEKTASWFHQKWKIPAETYRKCIRKCLSKTANIPQWYVILNDKQEIIAGAGIIENDFHDRQDLKPNLCALFVEKQYRKQGLAQFLLDFARKEAGDMGMKKLYLVTDLTDFYEKCGWTFMTMVNDTGGAPARLYAAPSL